MKNKAQIQLGESTAVIIVIIVMIFIGLIIYFNFWKSDQSVDITEKRDLAALELATRVSYLPELHCTFLGRASTNCFDKIKLEYISDSLTNEEWAFHYYDEFGYARITVHEIYPSAGNFLLYENEKEGPQSETPVFIPVNIYDAITDTYAFGYLEVVKLS